MSSKLTPEQAFAAVKVLWPETDFIYRTDSSWFTNKCCDKAPIDWQGLERYPPPEKKWRPAEWPRDASNPPKKCRVRNSDNYEWTHGYFLCGYRADIPYGWITTTSCWKFCEVEDDS